MLRTFVCTVFAFGAVACSSKDDPPPPTTCNVDTRSMKVSLSAQADANGTKLFAAVFDDAKGSLALDCGDTFSVTPVSGGDKIALTREPSSPGAIHYVGTASVTTAASAYVFSFDRPPPAVSAPTSHTYVPAPFVVSGGTSPINVSHGDAITLQLAPPMPVDATEVTPTTVRLRLEVSGSCVASQTYLWTPRVLFPPEVDPDGTVKLVTKLFQRQGTEPACDATLDVTELTGGDIDKAFAGGVTNGVDAEGSRHVPPITFHLVW
jgi:hypothetical protein